MNKKFPKKMLDNFTMIMPTKLQNEMNENFPKEIIKVIVKYFFKGIMLFSKNVWNNSQKKQKSVLREISM